MERWGSWIWGLLTIAIFGYGFIQSWPTIESYFSNGPVGVVFGLVAVAFMIGGIYYGIHLIQLGENRAEYYERLEADKEENESPVSTESFITSEWENKIADYVYSQVMGRYYVSRNDRTVIPGRNGGMNLEIDVYIPDLKLGIECNGCHWHDKAAYEKDCAYGTQNSDEMYKQKYCESHGITLLHVWDSSSMSTIQSQIDDAIRRQKQKCF